MDNLIENITHYAILIGIDEYPEKSLKGCVRDVQSVRAYLENTLQGALKIQMMTTAYGGGTQSGAADSALWPTHENVTAAFGRVASQAKAGDFVYIHYSGHGTRKPANGEFSNKSTGDLALVLLAEKEPNRVRYLWGCELAELLKSMADKGLVITLVLDCCFSGSVYRDDDKGTVRYLPYDETIASEHLVDIESSQTTDVAGYRDASSLPNWFIQPDRYAILAASGAHETAAEPKFDGQRHGALSYFLLGILKSAGLTKRHRDIFNHVRARFRGFGFNRQNPILYGNQTQAFFGKPNDDFMAVAIPVVVTKTGGLKLQAGRAHGVCDDDQFMLYPLGAGDDGKESRESSIISKVIDNGALTSELEPLEEPSARIRTGWIAEPITRLSLQAFPVRLPSDFPDRDEWAKALKARSLNVVTDESPSAFELIFKDGEIKAVGDSGSEMVNLPSTPQHQNDFSQMSSILEHLARFRLVKELDPKMEIHTFSEPYDIYMRSGGKRYDPGVTIEVKHRAGAQLFIRNKGNRVLYAYVYNLGPSWQVENVYQGTYAAVMAQNNGEKFTGITSIKLQMKVPENMEKQGYSSCEDIVKVFLTSQPTSFDLLELPKLGGQTRASNTYRTKRASEAPETWAALSFPIRTLLEQK